ncbi:hypothetical protein GO496_14535 [Acidovorax citrulli]|nr:hypothetical protein [Paracidovorax citrulli]
MDWLTFISKLIDSIAWPVAAVLLGLIFRKKLAELLPLLRKVKAAGPLEAEFEIATKQVLASTAELAAKERKPDTPRACYELCSSEWKSKVESADAPQALPDGCQR